jgi:4-hydroxy-3-polyprenylbenzoate decarboxylase
VERARKNYTNSRAIIDACRPFHWRSEFPRVNMPSPEQQARARARFGYLLE